MKVKGNIDYNVYRRRKKKNNKRLLFIFFSTFIGVLLFFTWLASALTPKIDIPALSNEEESAGLSSNDFKGRVDSRLNIIKMQDQNPYNERTEQKEVAQDTSLVEKAKLETEQIPRFKQEAKKQNDHQYDENLMDDMEAESYSSTTAQERAIAPPAKPTPQNTAPQAAPSQSTTAQNNSTSKPQSTNLNLRNKIDTPPKPAQMTKVYVGSYDTPSQARRASISLTESNPNLTPFIKEINGTYTLQVGSYTDSARAQEVVNTLRSQNNYVRVVRE